MLRKSKEQKNSPPYELVQRGEPSLPANFASVAVVAA